MIKCYHDFSGWNKITESSFNNIVKDSTISKKNNRQHKNSHKPQLPNPYWT